MAKNQKMLTLKEAAKISGYSSDYIGQLIRSGKLPGKQVYSNIAWVTTEEALAQYMAIRDSGGEHAAVGGPVAGGARKLKNIIISKFGTEQLISAALYGVISVCVALLLLMFYIFSVSFDKYLQERALERVQMTQ